MNKKTLNDTKPSADAIATDQGWVDAKTGELLVAIKNLKARLPVVKRGRGRPRKDSV